MKIFGAEPLRKYPGNLRVLLESSGRRKSGKSSSEVAPSKPSSVPNHKTIKNNKIKTFVLFNLTGCCFHTVRRMVYYYGKGVDWLLYSITATFAVKKEKRIETFFPISQLKTEKNTIE